ncbi:hypothetical protein [Paraburkholderia sp.]|uniref:hypothetical protein n=1 Tax=Paraburkholderia sp. TaxID=1926495 RepID=UPI002D28F754|nr:hypothetical protein [Paraburkholderia sp.]HZZ05709.1 hypothetical protein [Paraburkholderia sp.]
MPEFATAPALALPKYAHRPEPIEPPSPQPDPGEPDTIPSPTPDPIEPVAPPIGDPPPQPTQTPQASPRLQSHMSSMQL